MVKFTVIKFYGISTTVGVWEIGVSLWAMAGWLVAAQVGDEARYVDFDVFCRVERLSNIWGELAVYLGSFMTRSCVSVDNSVVGVCG